MSIEVRPLDKEYLEGAARLVARRYRTLCERVPVLPRRYAQMDILMPLLTEIVRSGPAVAALRGRALVGFLAGWPLPSFRGSPAAFSPEWAHAAEAREHRRIYEAMYTPLSALWVGGGHGGHLISLLATDDDAAVAFHWLGFGMAAVDAVRDLRPTGTPAARITARRAGPRDVDLVRSLNDALRGYIAGPPMFFADGGDREHGSVARWLADPDRAVWLAERGTQAVGFLGMGPASDDASTIIYDPGTASISGAFIRAEARGEGIASALLDRSLAWARARGYERCAVDFESTNPLAARFWLRHFQPVCYTLLRHIAPPSEGGEEKGDAARFVPLGSSPAGPPAKEDYESEPHEGRKDAD